MSDLVTVVYRSEPEAKVAPAELKVGDVIYDCDPRRPCRALTISAVFHSSVTCRRLVSSAKSPETVDIRQDAIHLHDYYRRRGFSRYQMNHRDRLVVRS
jgi:hypothetical protein